MEAINLGKFLGLSGALCDRDALCTLEPKPADDGESSPLPENSFKPAMRIKKIDRREKFMIYMSLRLCFPKSADSLMSRLNYYISAYEQLLES